MGISDFEIQGDLGIWGFGKIWWVEILVGFDGLGWAEADLDGSKTLSRKPDSKSRISPRFLSFLSVDFPRWSGASTHISWKAKRPRFQDAVSSLFQRISSQEEIRRSAFCFSFKALALALAQEFVFFWKLRSDLAQSPLFRKPRICFLLKIKIGTRSEPVLLKTKNLSSSENKIGPRSEPVLLKPKNFFSSEN